MDDPTPPLPTVEQITPTYPMVGALILHRTREKHGPPTGEFTDETVPTAAVADEQIGRAARYVALRLGTVRTQWTGDLVGSARDVVAAFAAYYIENSMPDGTGTEGRTTVDDLGDIARVSLAAVISTAQNNQPGAARMTSIQITGPTGRSRSRRDEIMREFFGDE